MVTHAHVLRARDTISDTLDATPLLTDHALSAGLGRAVRLKAELFLPTGSFKARGDLNWIRTARASELSHGLGAVSAGNHALALAWAARASGTPVTVVMPENASTFKVQGTRNLGADVILHGDIKAAWSHMDHLIRERKLTLVHPYDDPRIIAGQGTVALEIVEQAPDASVILCPIGGGGLISGIGLVLRELRPDIRLIGVEPAGAATMAHAWTMGGPSPLASVQTCARSLAAATVGKLTYRICRETVDELVTVTEEGIRDAVRHLLSSAKLHAEPGAAVGIAALMENRVRVPSADGSIIIIITGGNMGWDELATFL